MEGILKLNDLLSLTSEELSRAKIRFNTYNGAKNPIDEFKKNPELLLHWNYWNNKSYKEGQISIGLVKMRDREWLLFTVGVIIKVLDAPIEGRKDGGVQVEYETLDKYKGLYGRVVVDYKNKSQQLFRNARGLIDELVVKEFLPSVYNGFEFPGYDNVCLSFEELQTIVNGDYPGYHNALSNQKAVYLQTDKATGKLYVGSATAERKMLLARWSAYVHNGHGDNEDLKTLVEKKGFNYIKENFQYTILENYNAKVDDDFVLERERYWKRVLQSVKFGYNRNY